MKPFFNDISNFWANLVDLPNKFWGKLCFSDLIQIYPKYDIGRKEFGEIAIMCPYLVSLGVYLFPGFSLADSGFFLDF